MKTTRQCLSFVKIYTVDWDELKVNRDVYGTRRRGPRPALHEGVDQHVFGTVTTAYCQLV